MVAVNQFSHDTPAEIALLKNRIDHHSVPVVACDHWSRGSQGTLDLAQTVVETIAGTRANFKFVYDEQDSLWEKITKVATRIYGASGGGRRHPDTGPDPALPKGRIRTLPGLHRQDPVLLLPPTRC